jgi:hypothetical protein
VAAGFAAYWFARRSVFIGVAIAEVAFISIMA